MSRYGFTDDSGERWWVGYDPAESTFYLDRDSDLGDGYDPAPMRTCHEIQERAAGHVEIPTDVFTQLEHEQVVRESADEWGWWKTTNQRFTAEDGDPPHDRIG